MENEKNEIVVKNESSIVSNTMKDTYCSVNPSTIEEKKKLFNAIESCDLLLNDCVGEEINLKNVYIDRKEVCDEATGELRYKYRTILFDENGKTYVTGSYGIYNILMRIFSIYGEPTVWNEPVKVKVAKRAMSKDKSKSVLTLVLL